MLAAMASFSAGDTMTKLMASEVPVGQIIFFRGLVATTVIIVICARQGLLPHAGLIFQKKVMLRSLSDVLGTIAFIIALGHMPIANLTAILQAVPLAATGFAALFLGEKVGIRRVTAILVGFAGVLFIVKPTPASFTVYDGLALGLVLSVALRDIFTRQLTFQVPTMIVVLANSAFVMLSGLGLYAFEDWVALTPRHLLLLLCGGLFLSSGYVCMVLTIRMGDISTTAFYRYSMALFALLSGIFVFGEFPDGPALLGIALIVGSGVYALIREMRLAKSA